MVDDAQIGGQGRVGTRVAMLQIFQQRPVDVEGAGELGLPVLRNLARVAERAPGSSISVLLRESTINTQVPAKKAEIDELRALGIRMVAADLVNDTIEEKLKKHASPGLAPNLASVNPMGNFMPAAPANGTIDVSRLGIPELKLSELQERLTALNEPTSGLRDNMVARLEGALSRQPAASAATAEPPPPTTAPSATASPSTSALATAQVEARLRGQQWFGSSTPGGRAATGGKAVAAGVLGVAGAAVGSRPQQSGPRGAPMTSAALPKRARPYIATQPPRLRT